MTLIRLADYFIKPLSSGWQQTIKISFGAMLPITTTFEELVERAVFWEDYGQRYPNGYAVKDTKFLLDVYRNAIFFDLACRWRQ